MTEAHTFALGAASFVVVTSGAPELSGWHWFVAEAYHATNDRAVAVVRTFDGRCVKTLAGTPAAARSALVERLERSLGVTSREVGRTEVPSDIARAKTWCLPNDRVGD